MKKYKVSVTRTNTYEIEIDETIWTPEELRKWETSFYPTADTKDLAAHLAASLTMLGVDHGFIEGFGYVTTFNKSGSRVMHWRMRANGDPILVDNKEYTLGLNAKVIEESDCDEVEIIEL